MQSPKEHITASLELVADQHGDPTALIYETLFRDRPDLEELFVMDTDGGVRGSMLQYTFDCITDYAGDGLYVHNFISTTRDHHDGYGVPEDIFDQFFVTVMETFRTLLDQHWHDDMDAAWRQMIADFSQMREQP